MLNIKCETNKIQKYLSVSAVNHEIITKKDNAKFQVKFSIERLYHICDPLQAYQ
jgi:hypothetical protein